MSRGRYERRKKGPGAGKIILIILAVILVLVIAAAAVGWYAYNSVLNKMNHVEVPKINYTTAPTEVLETEAVEATEEVTVPTETVHVPSSEDYVNVLLVGQAARAGEVERFADTMILVTINKYEKSVTLTSMLRDTLVQPPKFRGHGFGKIKLTTVYHLGSFYDNGNIGGSMELINQTLYDNFGVEVDHNIEIDFDCFVKIIDILGGLDIELTQEEVDYLLKDDHFVHYETLEPGWNCLDGMAALSYARMRKAEGDGESDIKRTARQRQVITNMIGRLRYLGADQVQKISNEVLPMITTSMTNEEITDLLMLLLPMLSDLTITQGGTCPVEGTYWGDMVDIYDNGFQHSVVKFVPQEQKKLMRAITEGEIAE